jgi:hypothetical protein
MICNCQIADRLPFTGDTLVSSKIGKIVRKLAKDAPIPGELFTHVYHSYFFGVWCQGVFEFLFMVTSRTPITPLLPFVKSLQQGEMTDYDVHSCNVFYSGQGYGGKS